MLSASCVVDAELCQGLAVKVLWFLHHPSEFARELQVLIAGAVFPFPLVR